MPFFCSIFFCIAWFCVEFGCGWELEAGLLEGGWERMDEVFYLSSSFLYEAMI